MARRAFYSFHYQPDNSRAAQVRNMSVIEGNAPASDNDWETVTKGGDAAIKRWIDGQLNGKGVTVVLIGSGTAGRKWINYEIETSWRDKKGVLGIYIHRLKNFEKQQAQKGLNPFDSITIGENRKLSSIVKAYDPPNWDSQAAYQHIKDNLAGWIEEAVSIRENYKESRAA